MVSINILLGQSQNVSQKLTNFDRIQALKFSFTSGLGEIWHENLWDFLKEYKSVFQMSEKKFGFTLSQNKSNAGDSEIM